MSKYSQQFGRVRAQIAKLGYLNWIKFQLARRIGPPSTVFYLKAPMLQHSVACRSATSDTSVFQQVLMEPVYSGVLQYMHTPGLILDCGANVGYSAAYFLSAFPSSQLIAVEPDPGNFEMLQRNLAPYGKRAVLHCGAVWSYKCGLVFDRQYRDGLAWSVRVRPAMSGEVPSLMATDIGTLLQESGFERISILKMDIERAEAEVFMHNYAHWIDKVDVIAIELHDAACEAAFFGAIEGRNFSYRNVGDIVLCYREVRPGGAES